MSTPPFVRPPWQYPTTVSSVLVVGPVDEPLTLAEGKLRAALDWPAGDPRDELMLGFIAAARQKVEHDTGLALLTQTRAVTIAASDTGITPLPVQAMPVQSITVPGGRALDPSEFAIDFVARRLHWAPDARVVEGGTWTIVAGWLDPATLKKDAPLLVHAVGLLVAHFATLGRDLASIDEPYELPLGYEDAIAPYRAVWVT